MKKHLLMVKQLDKQLKPWRSLASHFRRPKVGWIKTIRNALGMTAQQLAKKLGLQRARVTQLEHSEIEDAVTLRALRAAAQAMNCELIYAIVPKQPLEETLKMKALELAKKQVKKVDHSMALEDQAIDETLQKELLERLAQEFLDGSLKKLWKKNK